MVLVVPVHWLDHHHSSRCFLHLGSCSDLAPLPCSPHLDCPADDWICGKCKIRSSFKLEGDLRGVDGRGGVDGGVAAAGVALLLQTEETTREGFHKLNKR